MKTVKVHMLAFLLPGNVREVDIPEHENVTLDTVYYYGQNDIQPKECPSVSMGDVIELAGDFYLVCAVGFLHITTEQLIKYACSDSRHKHLVKLINSRHTNNI